MSNEMNIPLENYFSETLAETISDWPLNQLEIATATGIPSPHLSGMKAGDRRCTPEYDLRLSRFFGTTVGFWMRLQLDYEMEEAKKSLGNRIEREVTPSEAA